MALQGCQNTDCNPEFPKLSISICKECFKCFCLLHIDEHVCEKRVLSSIEESDFNLDSLNRIRQSASRLNSSMQKELEDEYNKLGVEFKKIDGELEEIVHLVRGGGGYGESLKKKIFEFDSRASGKYCIRLRQKIKFEMKKFYKCLCGIEQNSKLGDSETSIMNTSDRSIGRNCVEYKDYQCIRRGSGRVDLFIEISEELKLKMDVNELFGDFNDNIELFKYFRKSKLTKLASVILAILESANRCLNDLDTYKNYLERFDSFIDLKLTDLVITKNKDEIFTPNSLFLLKQLSESPNLPKLQEFKELAGIYIYDHSLPKNSKLQVFSNTNSLFDIFMVVRQNYFQILMPQKKHYQSVKHLWVQNSFFNGLP